LFQEFNDRRDAEDAVYELNGKELCGDRLVHILYNSIVNCDETTAWAQKLGRLNYF